MPRADAPADQHQALLGSTSGGAAAAADDDGPQQRPWSQAEISEAAAAMPATAPAEDQEPLNAEDPAARLHWTALPPMPSRHKGEMRSQACGGITVVMAIIAMCVGGTHFFTSGMEGTPFFVLSVAVWAEAAVALLCLLGLMYGDPGELKRSEANCMPVPDGQIKDLLLRGQPLPDRLAQIHDPVRGHYCTRCLIWRGTHQNVHHCSTCQRCVCDFDHHCGVFGRCIAGQGFGGNMGYFKTIIMMAVLGIVTAMAASVSGANDRMQPPAPSSG
jgi:hypothetical protein